MLPYNEVILETSPLGIKIAFQTKANGYTPLHWHDALEILYPLNGKSDVFIDGETYHQPNKQLLVIDSCQIHSTYHHGDSAMFLCIQITKKSLEWYFPGIQDYYIHCSPDMISDADFPVYLEMCEKLKQVTELYIKNSPAFLLESEGLILQLFSLLLQYFSSSRAPSLPDADKLAMKRIRTVMEYVENHFAETISLNDAAGLLNLGKEYFCRFFKKNMGISFLQYVNEVRTAHIYQDLIHTDEPIQELIDKNGFTNQKLFNRTFKALYGCTPSQARKNAGKKAADTF